MTDDLQPIPLFNLKEQHESLKKQLNEAAVEALRRLDRSAPYAGEDSHRRQRHSSAGIAVMQVL